MEAKMITPATQNSVNNRELSRIGLIIGGIMVAIITVIFLTHDGVDTGFMSWIPQFVAGNKMVFQSTPGVDVPNVPDLLSILIQF